MYDLTSSQPGLFLESLKLHLVTKALPPGSMPRLLELRWGERSWLQQARLSSGLVAAPDRLDLSRLALPEPGHEGIGQAKLPQRILRDLPAASYDLVLVGDGVLNTACDPSAIIGEIRSVCRPGCLILFDCLSRQAFLPDLFLAGDIAGLQALLGSGACKIRLRNQVFQGHAFESCELVELLWGAGLTVISALGRSALLTLLGPRRLARLLRTVPLAQAITLEESLAEVESLLNLAAHLEVLCQVPDNGNEHADVQHLRVPAPNHIRRHMSMG